MHVVWCSGRPATERPGTERPGAEHSAPLLKTKDLRGLLLSCRHFAEQDGAHLTSRKVWIAVVKGVSEK